MEDPRALWHTQQDHLHHTNAVQGLSRKGDRSAAQNCHTASRFKQGSDKDACSHHYSLTFE